MKRRREAVRLEREAQIANGPVAKGPDGRQCDGRRRTDRLGWGRFAASGRLWCGWLAVVVMAAAVARIEPAYGAEPSAPAVDFRPEERIVLLGGTFVERLQQDNYLEMLLTTSFPEKKITFRNLGWSGDTVGGESRGVFGGPNEGFARLVKDVKEAKPTVIVVQYGANEAFRGPDGVGPFTAGLQRLFEALADTRARFILVSPSPREKLPRPLPDPTTYNEHLKLYEAAMRKVASERGAAFVSLADLLDASAARLDSPAPLTDNGLHFNQVGAYLTAQTIAEKFGARSSPWQLNVDIATRKFDPKGAQVREPKPGEKSFTCEIAEETGPFPLPPSDLTRQGKKLGFPVLTVTGLPAGKYLIKVDGTAVGDGVTAEQLRAGVTLAIPAHLRVAAQLREVIRVKNELYFHRHRPQNETYLFLFRKHEQGQNAVEIPQFDPLVAEKEQQIAQLAQPKKLQLEVRPVE